MQSNNSDKDKTNRFDVIKITKTPLAFYVLIAIICETVFGSMAISSKGNIQILSVYALITISLLLVIVVTFLTIYKPGYLLGNFSSVKDSADFCDKIAGIWWERVTPDESSALSFVLIKPNIDTGTPIIQGTTYNLEGELIANWESEASCINITTNKVWYYWKGFHIESPEIPFGGFGEITFDDSDTPITKGKGLFTDTNFTDLKTTKWKATRFRRCTLKESELVKKNNSQLLKECIKLAIQNMD